MNENISFFSTQKLDLAAALLAVGIKFSKRPTKVTSEKGSTYTFFFEGRNEDYKTADLVAAWHDPNWIEQNPEHPFSFIMAAFTNRDFLLDNMKQFRRLVMVESKGKTRLIPEDAADEQLEKLLRL